MGKLASQFDRRQARVRRSLRKRAYGRPRLTVFRSLQNIYAQVIDDATGRTIVSASTMEKDIRSGIKNGGNKAAAVTIGKLIAERALKTGVTHVVFDRGGYMYHGRVKALADAAREKGLNF